VTGFRRLQQRTVLKTRVFSIRQEHWRGPDGNLFERQTVVHPGAVAIVPMDRQGRILFIEQFRPATGETLLEIPAGTLEKGERPLACAKRELKEEIGSAAKKWKKLGELYTAPGFCNELIHLYNAWDLKAASAEKDEDEHIVVVPHSLPQIRQALRAGRIRDAKTMSALLYLAWT